MRHDEPVFLTPVSTSTWFLILTKAQHCADWHRGILLRIPKNGHDHCFEIQSFKLLFIPWRIWEYMKKSIVKWNQPPKHCSTRRIHILIYSSMMTHATYWQGGLSGWLIISISSFSPAGLRLWTLTKPTRAAFDPQPPEPAARRIMSEGKQWPDNDPLPQALCCHNIHTNTLCFLEFLVSKFQCSSFYFYLHLNCFLVLYL